MAFQKGKSGNPGGKPKDKPFRDALLMELKSAGEDMPQLRKIAKKMIELAEKGDKDARKELSDRLDGKPHQSMDVTADVVLSHEDALDELDDGSGKGDQA